MAVIRSTDLDFDTIKASLKIYLEQQSEFADYDFEASGLSNILDVLAYNTHVNGLIANLGINEAFLNSAQLRSSVVSHAETLGYAARSKTGAGATVNLSVNTSNTTTTNITIPKYTEFTASIDDISYTFQTLETYTGTNNGSGLFNITTSAGLSDITIYEGTLKTKTFLVGEDTEEQFYVIPDENIDTSTISVNVFDTVTSATFTPYVDVSQVARINTDSTVYFIREAPNGYYELTFSDGNILGQKPLSGNKIVVQYLQTSGPVANGGKVFVANDKIGIDGTDYDLDVTLVSQSAGGAEKESISSIKLNAPLAFAAQQRLVTAEDYKALILANYSSVIEDVSAWGGQDNVPPEYGKVFVSLKFVDNLSDAVKQVTKDSIVTNLTNNLSVMSIGTEFTDPVTTFLQCETAFNFNPDLAGASLQTTEVDFPARLASPDDVNHRVTTTEFTFADQTALIRNQLNSTKLQVVTPAGTILKDNVGSYNPVTATVSIRGFNPSAFEGPIIKVTVTPANQARIAPLRNYIINIDESLSFSQGSIDYQTTSTVIS